MLAASWRRTAAAPDRLPPHRDPLGASRAPTCSPD